MSDNLEQNIVGIAIGIRFLQNYSIVDHFGSISDEILYNDNAYFVPAIFPRIQTVGYELRLFNDDTNNKLVFNIQNALLELSFDDDFILQKKDLPNIISSFEEFVLKGVFQKVPIRRFVRIGYIQKFLLKMRN